MVAAARLRLIVQAASGIADQTRSVSGVPGVLPAQALDHGAGHLLAATVLRARSVAEANAWYAFAAEAFLAAYRSAAPAAITDPATWRACLDFYLVEKCLYEIAYEANNRPDWLAIPRDGLGALLDSEPTK